MTVRTFTSNRPGTPTLKLQRVIPTLTEEYMSMPFRRRLAWLLRRLADRLEPDGMTLRLSGSIYGSCSIEDVWDGLCHGLAATQSYLADLHDERQVK